MSLIDEIKADLARMDAAARKSLGQNFLVNEQVISQIVEAVQEAGGQHLIEIGPGLGALTKSLAGLKPLLVELDKKFASDWQAKGFEVIQQDALKVDWQSLLGSRPNCVLVSNLPYQISSSLVIERCLDPAPLRQMVLMFQKEVAQRITAPENEKNYGLLSVIAQSFWETETVCDAGPGSFFPPPKVSSRVLKFRWKESAWESDVRTRFLAFVKAAFRQRRKKMLKNLPRLPENGSESESGWEEIFESAGLPQDVRPQAVSVEDFQNLFKLFEIHVNQ